MLVIAAGSIVLTAVVYGIVARLSKKEIRRNADAEPSHEPDEELGPDENTPPWMKRLP